MATFADLWRDQQNAPFPFGSLNRSIDGTPLVKIDAAAGAILTGCLRSDAVPRPLDDGRRKELQRLRGLIDRALREGAVDAEGVTYFERLRALADLILTP